MVAVPFSQRQILFVHPVCQIMSLGEIALCAARQRHKRHQSPVPNQQAHTPDNPATDIEETENQSRKQVGERNSLEHAQEPDAFEWIAETKIPSRYNSTARGRMRFSAPIRPSCSTTRLSDKTSNIPAMNTNIGNIRSSKWNPARAAWSSSYHIPCGYGSPFAIRP
jgi:hypothetical protein